MRLCQINSKQRTTSKQILIAEMQMVIVVNKHYLLMSGLPSALDLEVVAVDGEMEDCGEEGAGKEQEVGREDDEGREGEDGEGDDIGRAGVVETDGIGIEADAGREGVRGGENEEDDVVLDGGGVGREEAREDCEIAGRESCICVTGPKPGGGGTPEWLEDDVVLDIMCDCCLSSRVFCWASSNCIRFCW